MNNCGQGKQHLCCSGFPQYKCGWTVWRKSSQAAGFKTIIRPFLLLMLVGLLSCSPSLQRIGYQAPSLSQPSECDVMFVKSSIVSNTGRRLGAVVIHKGFFNRAFSEQQAMDLIRNEACRIGANRASYSITEESSVFFRTRFTFYADLYREE